MWHCQCSICERAMMNANMGANTVPTQAQLAQTQQQQQQQPPVSDRVQPQQPQVEIKIQEAPVQYAAAEEEEEEEDLDDSEDGSELIDGESERGDDAYATFSPAPTPVTVPAHEPHPPSRKRRSSDLELDPDSDTLSLTTAATDPSDASERSRTPPKRMRREGSFEHDLSASSVPLSPSVASTTTKSASVPPLVTSSPLGQRQRKRSSEELDLDDELPLSTKGKRMKGEDGSATESEPRTPSVKGVELELERIPPRTPSKEYEPRTPSRVSRMSATPTATVVAAREQSVVPGVVQAN